MVPDPLGRGSGYTQTLMPFLHDHRIPERTGGQRRKPRRLRGDSWRVPAVTHQPVSATNVTGRPNATLAALQTVRGERRMEVPIWLCRRGAPVAKQADPKSPGADPRPAGPSVKVHVWADGRRRVSNKGGRNPQREKHKLQRERPDRL